MNSRSLLLSATAALLWSGTAWADGDAARKDRHDELAMTSGVVGQACDTIAGWAIMDEMDASISMEILKDPKSPDYLRKKAQKTLEKMDADAKGLDSNGKLKLHESVRKAKAACKSVRSEDALPALSGDGVALEKLSKDQWTAISDKLCGIVHTFQKQGCRPKDSNPKNYGNSYGGMPASSAKIHLAENVQADLEPLADGLIEEALQAISGKDPDEGRSDP
jgi:hypothetical protein